MYDPTVARFTTEDPLDFDAGDPNLYRYVGNSPTNATDPSGMWLLIHNTEQEQKAFSALAERAGVKLGFSQSNDAAYLRLDVSKAQGDEARKAIANELRKLGLDQQRDNGAKTAVD